MLAVGLDAVDVDNEVILDSCELARFELRWMQMLTSSSKSSAAVDAGIFGRCFQTLGEYAGVCTKEGRLRVRF